MTVLSRGRRAAEARMTSTGKVWRKDLTTPVVVDGLETPHWTAEHSTLAGRLAGTSGGAAQTRRVSIGQTEVQLAVREWHCPVGTTNLRDGDVIEVTAGENAGIFLRVIEATGQDQSTARRVPVVEIQKPGGIA